MSGASNDVLPTDIMFRQYVKEECPHEMELNSGASNEEPSTDIMSGQCVKEERPQEMECMWLTVKQEPQEEELPVQDMKDESPPSMEEPDVHYNMLSLKVEPKDEVPLDEHCISPEWRSDGVLTSSSVQDGSDFRTSISATVPLHSSPVSTDISECYNSRNTLKGDHITEGNYKSIAEVPYSISVNQGPIAGIVAMETLKQEQIGDIMRIETIKQEEPHVQEATYMNQSVFSLKVDPKDETTIEDHCISPGEGSDGVPTWSSGNGMSNLGTCTTDSTSSQPSVFCAKLFDNHNQGHSLKNDHSVDYNAQNTLLKKVKTNVSMNVGRKKIKVVHKCMECGKCFTQSGRLNQHLKIHSGEKDHKCTECGKCFTYSFGLRAHLKIHSGKKEHECTKCGKWFTHRGGFKEHLKIHSGKKDYKCTECGKCFTLSNSLRQHLKTHSSQKVYECTECAKSFTQNSSLKKHLKVHSGGKDHKCTECGSCFTQRSSLKQHLKIHSGEKTYTCTACGKCFTQSSGLRQHLKIHSCEKNRKCTDCGKCFTSSSGLRQHLKIYSHKNGIQNVRTALP